MTQWGQSLTALTWLDPGQRRRLQALAITTVEDLNAALAATPDDLAHFLGVENVSSLVPFAPQTVDYLAFNPDELPSLGAEPPPEVDVLDQASEELFAASLEALGPEPEAEEQPLAQAPILVDCIACMRPIRNQGARGTCVAHAVAAVFECLQLRDTGHAVDLSPQFLYWSAKQHDGNSTSGGTFIRVATDRAVKDGICEETDWPYFPSGIPGNESQDPSPPGAATAASHRRAANVVAITPKSSAAVRQSLDNQIPIAFSIPVYAYWVSPNGKVPMPIPGAPRIGGHAMCAAGYLLDAGAPGGGFVVAKNSWGTARAPLSPAGAGYYYVPFDYIDQYGWESQTLS